MNTINQNLKHHSQPGCEGKLGVLLKRYPKLSETFILGEILGLEQAQIKLILFSLYLPSDTIQHSSTSLLKAPVCYIHKNGLVNLGQMLAQHAWLMLRAPLRYLRVVHWTLKREEPDKIRDFLHAGVLASKLIAHQITHLYTHFISEPAAVTEIACQLADINFSLSAHAKDIYLSAPQVLRRKLHAASFTVTCTEYNHRHLDKIAHGAGRVRCMYHGLDLQLFDAALRAPAGTTQVPLIISVGRLREKKGFVDLIYACRRLIDVQQKFHCMIIGYGPDYADLQQLIRKLGLEQIVRLTGKMPHPEILKLYRKASVFALPCRIASDGDRDGIPNVILEAMAMHLPVVSCPVSGVPEVVKDALNGLLVESTNVSALADALMLLLKDAKMRHRLGMAGREIVEKEFSSTQNLQHLIKLLNQTMPQAPETVAQEENAYAAK